MAQDQRGVPSGLPASLAPPSAPAMAQAEPPAVSFPRAASHASTLAEVTAGHAALRSGRLGEALEAYARAREADPLSLEAHLFMGIGFHLAGQPENATACLRSALFLDPDLWPAELYLALSLENLGQAEDACRHWVRALEGRASPLPSQTRGSPLEDFEEWKADRLRRHAGPRGSVADAASSSP
ncbi:MAG: tetratricopeptide repeat protein [Deltaproteobacteria bacterium]|nr:tetratricopeptide repeat protein [Deltaproteobacteria bacterium]